MPNEWIECLLHSIFFKKNPMVVIVDGIWIFLFSAVAWQLTLTSPAKSTESGNVRGLHEDRDKPEGSLYILLFKSLINSDSAVGSQLLCLL